MKKSKARQASGRKTSNEEEPLRKLAQLGKKSDLRTVLREVKAKIINRPSTAWKTSTNWLNLKVLNKYVFVNASFEKREAP